MFGVVCKITMRVFKTQPVQIIFRSRKSTRSSTRELKALKEVYDQVFRMLLPTTGKLLWQCWKFVELGTTEPAFLDRPD
jgi:hypothetical protein